MRLRDMVIQRSKLLEISVTLNSTLELDTLLQFIINSAADLMDSEGASILLVDENTKDLYFAAATGADPEELRTHSGAAVWFDRRHHLPGGQVPDHQ